VNRCCSVDQAVQLLQSERQIDLRTLGRHFNLQADDIFAGAFGGALWERLRNEAPHSVLHFIPEGDLDRDVFEDGTTDLCIGALRPMRSDISVQSLFTTTFVGLAHREHPIFHAEITPRRFASFEQVSVSRLGHASGPIDTALNALGLQRTVSLIVPTFDSALFSLGSSNLILALPEHLACTARRMGISRGSFRFPFR
jgi:DNA-binding transcriptional LysR family regulator